MDIAGRRPGHHHPTGHLTSASLKLDKLHQVCNPQLKPEHLLRQLLDNQRDFLRRLRLKLSEQLDNFLKSLNRDLRIVIYLGSTPGRINLGREYFMTPE